MRLRSFSVSAKNRISCFWRIARSFSLRPSLQHKATLWEPSGLCAGLSSTRILRWPSLRGEGARLVRHTKGVGGLWGAFHQHTRTDILGWNDNVVPANQEF